VCRLGYDWEEVVSALRCSCKRTEVRGFKEGEVYDQMYRGSASRGTLVPFFVRAPMGALRCFSIMAQDFSPGRLVCWLGKKDVVFIFLLFFIFGIL
jgi:hypothetical protein